MDDDIADLMGEPPKPRKKTQPRPRVNPIRRPIGDKAMRRVRKKQMADDGIVDLRLEAIFKGVSSTWLSKVLRMDLAEVKRRLSVVTPMSGAKNQAKYDLKTALPHMVDPVTDVEEYLKNLDPKDLPPKLSAAFWQGMKIRMQTMEQAGQLWSTPLVFEVYGEIFKTIRTQMNLWLDTLDENSKVSDKQREILAEMIDSLAADILRSMEKFAKESGTRSEVEWVEAYVDEHG